jgi:hypothetical protein
MVKAKVTVRQIEAAKESLYGKLKEREDEYRRVNPPPNWEAETEWQRLHPSPTTKWNSKKRTFFMRDKKRAENAIFRAKMEMLSGEDLLKFVEEF